MPPIDADAFNDFERRGWAENSADAYGRVFGPVTRRVIDDLLDAAGAGHGVRLLDVATGPGYVAARASERGASVVAIDLSAQMLELARNTSPDIVFLQGDAERIPLGSASFDAVVANFCLLHVGRPEQALSEMARVLVPSGRMAVTVWGTPDRARIFGLVPDALKAAGAAPSGEIPEGPDFFRFSLDAEFVRSLEAAGLDEATVKTIEFAHRIPSAAHLWDGMLHGSVRTRALLALQTAETRERIYDEFESLLEPLRVEGGFDVPVCVKLASGRKPPKRP